MSPEDTEKFMFFYDVICPLIGLVLAVTFWIIILCLSPAQASSQNGVWITGNFYELINLSVLQENVTCIRLERSISCNFP